MTTGPQDPAPAGRGRLRAGHADREQVIGTLKTAFVHGQLTKDELDTRAGQALCLASGVWSFGSGAHWRTLAWGLVLCSVLLRLIYCSQIELLPEESYYWK